MSTLKSGLRSWPPTVLIVEAAMIVSALVILVTFGAALSWVLSFEVTRTSPYIIPAGIIAVVSAGVSVLAAWAVLRGSRVAPVLVTIVGVWNVLAAIANRDALSLVAAAASIGATIAVWLPASRVFMASRRAARVD